MKKILRTVTMGLAAIACFAFIACTPSSLADAKDKMAKEGYRVDASNISAEGMVGGFTAIKTEGGLIVETDVILAFLFESKDDAKKFKADFDNLVGKEYSPIQDGKWVYAGTEDAIEDFTD